MAVQVIDDAIQAHGGAGVAEDLASRAYANACLIRLADGPDRGTIAP
jgi:acyl-CoA dehydrogenase